MQLTHDELRALGWEADCDILPVEANVERSQPSKTQAELAYAFACRRQRSRPVSMERYAVAEASYTGEVSETSQTSC